ncbi:acid-sensing ion channel 1-like [Ostrea edulis]|uniref:acid-sensing ion channel 1-like n=1 Tax=Ostrea edulis TaxID=37623 RepID=UPI0024AEE543|nr:acid-sensing ion channel 1-like [Ostrea edulis]
MMSTLIHPKETGGESKSEQSADGRNTSDSEDGDVGKRNKSLRKLWWEFLSETTCHGFGRVTIIQRNRIRGLLWISFLLTSMTFVAVCLVQEFQSYFSYPFTSKSFLETFERMPFPAVTICNMGSKNRSKSSKSQKDADYWLSVSSVAVFATKKVDWNDSYYRENGYFEPNSLEKELNISMDVSKFILFSTFDFMTELVFKPTLTSLGICHTWNGDGNVTTKMTGSLYNLRVMLDIHRDLYEFGLTATTGVKVIVHEPGTAVDPIYEGFAVAPGVSALASVSKKRFSFLPYPFKAFVDGYCVDTQASDFVNKFYPIPYSIGTCKRFCFSEIVFERCGCVQVGDLGNHSYCSKYQMSTCYLKEMMNLVYQDVLGDVQCDCPYPCEEMRYDVTVSTNQFPSDSFAKIASSHFNVSEERIRDNILEISIFYDQLFYFWMKQIPKYERMGDVLASIGGQMGLFIGASVLTIMEFFEVIFLVLLFILKQFISKPRTGSKDPGL